MAGDQHTKTIAATDLVNHILMDESWVGIVIRLEQFKLEEDDINKALIYIVSPHSFSKWHGGSQSNVKKDENYSMKIGWVDVDFLKLISKGVMK